MRQLLLDKRNIVVKNVAQPLLDDHSILVAVHYAFISSWTCIENVHRQEHFLSNVPQKVKRVLQAVSLQARSPEKTFTGLGYPCTGHVISVGKKVHHFAPGDLVACADPGYTMQTDLMCIPAWHAVKISHHEHIKSAALTTFAAVALHGVKQARLHLGQRVAIFGMGMLGQFAVQLAKLSGCEVIACDDMPDRLALAETNGADYCFNRAYEDIGKEVDLITQRYGVDAAIVTQDHDLATVLSITRSQGRIVLLGGSSRTLPSDDQHDKQHEIVFIPSTGTDQIPYENLQICLKLIEQGKLRVQSLIDQHVELDQLSAAYTRIEAKSALGVLLSYNRTMQQAMPVTSCVDAPSAATSGLTRFIPARSDVIRVGVIGAGDFAQSTLIPLISTIRNVQVKAIVDADMRNSIQASSQCAGSKACAQEDDLFSNDLIDVVVIASPHAFHCDQAVKALSHGKAVFLEKPMVTDFSQLQELCTLLSRNPTMPFCVDYNRSFAPFTKKIKQVVAKRNTPLMMQYRVNTSQPAHNWIYSQVGAGRIIGDACQIVDLFCSLTDARPISVSVEAMHAARDDVFPTDNFTTHISFDDGSIGTLLFSTLGHPDMGSERFELFYDEKAILMEDFMELYGFGLPSWFNETITTPDKGHEALVQTFFAGLSAEQFQPPIPVDRLHLVAELTLLIDQLACEGGGSKDL